MEGNLRSLWHVFVKYLASDQNEGSCIAKTVGHTQAQRQEPRQKVMVMRIKNPPVQCLWSPESNAQQDPADCLKWVPSWEDWGTLSPIQRNRLAAPWPAAKQKIQGNSRSRGLYFFSFQIGQAGCISFSHKHVRSDRVRVKFRPRKAGCALLDGTYCFYGFNIFAGPHSSNIKAATLEKNATSGCVVEISPCSPEIRILLESLREGLILATKKNSNLLNRLRWQKEVSNSFLRPRRTRTCSTDWHDKKRSATPSITATQIRGNATSKIGFYKNAHYTLKQYGNWGKIPANPCQDVTGDRRDWPAQKSPWTDPEPMPSMSWLPSEFRTVPESLQPKFTHFDKSHCNQIYSLW